ncbi:hypothetical protein DINM_020802 [Dirofilaria immitis]|nr:hypothetical protein [Dirofilaria immitis]
MHMFYGLWIIFLFIPYVLSRTKCNPIYVRWQRVRIIFGAQIEGPYSFHTCKNACANDEDPIRSDNEVQCSGFNHRQGLQQYSQHCQLYQADQLQHGETNKTCSGDYAFTYLSDRYMDRREVHEVIRTRTLEDCLSACLDAVNYACRSVSYNRTDGDCFLSQHNQLSKPSLIKINNNPNYRIDYYENSCTNNSFTFDYECKDDGIQVKVISKYPYTGAMYGLYDFFTCRIEPKDDTKFEYFFPSPTVSKNCSDSIRYKGRDMVLEIVISTDGVEPLYFITPDDLTYQARCPLNEPKLLSENTDNILNIKSDTTGDNYKMIISAHALFSALANATKQQQQQQLSNISNNLSIQQHTVTDQIKDIVDHTFDSVNDTTNNHPLLLLTLLLLLLLQQFTTTTTTTVPTTTTTIPTTTTTTVPTTTTSIPTTTTTTVPTTTTTIPTTTTTTIPTITTTIPTTTTTTIPTTTTATIPTTTTTIPTTTTITTTITIATTTTAIPTTTTTTIDSPTETLEWNSDTIIDKYDENISITTNTITTDHSISSTNLELEIFTSVMDRITPKEIISSQTSDKFSTILNEISSIERSTVSSETISMHTVTSESSVTFGTEILNKITTTTTTATTTENGKTSSDDTLNEIQQKHESTIIAPINEIKISSIGSDSSTMFVSSRTIPMNAEKHITSMIFTDSSSDSSTGSTIEAPLFTYTSNEITQQPIYNTIMTLTSVNDATETSILSSALPTMSEFALPTSLSDAEENSRNAESSSSSSPSSSSSSPSSSSSSSLSSSLSSLSLSSSSSSSLSQSSSSSSASSSPPLSSSTMTSLEETTTTTTNDTSAIITTATTTTTATATATTTTTTMETAPEAMTTTKTATTITTTATVITPIEATETIRITAEAIKTDNDHPVTETLQLSSLSSGISDKDDNNVSIAQKVVGIASNNITTDVYSVNKSLSQVNVTGRTSKDDVIFDIFHNGQPVEAVVVGSKITLSFIPYLAIPSTYMTVKSCHVEPIGSLYEWERDPLTIIKDGCQADHVGLVCPPQKTEYGIRIIAESFRYQTTSQVQYSCLIRICSFAPCPTEICEEVDGCGRSNLLSNTFGLRHKRHITIEQIRAALAANPDLQRQIRLMNRFGTQSQTTSEIQQQLIRLGGDHIVKKQLVVVNSEDELRYYVRTGDVP